MQGRRRFRAVALAGSVCALLALAAAANASAATLYVSNSAQVVTNGKSCAQPGYASVKAALIVAASGSRIAVCPGTYTEQIEIKKGVKVEAINGIGTVTLAMPASPSDSQTLCDTMDGLEQIDEISVCTPEAVTLLNLDIDAVVPLETCGKGLYGVFVGDDATLTATGDTIDGASTSLADYRGCQHGVAVEVGSIEPEEVGNAKLKAVTVSGYEKNGPTVAGIGSTMTVTGSTVTGEGPSPDIAQNGIQVAFGGKGTITTTTVSGNECEYVGVCSPGTPEQASGVLFYQAAPGSRLTSSTVKENDLGVYYASGRSALSSTPEVTAAKDVLTSNRYEGIELEEGKASFSADTINGTGLVGIDIYQTDGQLSASESSASGAKVEGQTEAAIKVESDKQPGDIPGKFTFHGTTANDGTVLINESSTFQVVF